MVGLFFAFVGLAVLPVNRQVLSPWQNAVYGATFMGWGATLFFVGRLAFRRRDSELMKALLYGLFVWFPVESLFSAYFRVWFNVGVDVAVLAVLSLPLIIAIRLLDAASGRKPSVAKLCARIRVRLARAGFHGFRFRDYEYKDRRHRASRSSFIERCTSSVW